MRALSGGEIGMVFQEPMVSLNPAMTVGAQMAEGLRLHYRLGRREIRERSLAMLERVRIPRPLAALGAWPHQFSGGMRQRIMLASVMLLKPKLLIADEPTTALDMLSQREVLDLMVALARDEGAAVLLITHDLGVVGRYAERAVVLRRGRLVEEAETARLLAAPREPYTRSLVASFAERLPPRPAPVRTDPVIAVKGLAVRHPGRRLLFGRAVGPLAVAGVDLEVGRGEVVALVGGSGSGKTTLGRAILGLLPLEAGRVSVNGAELGAAGRAARLGCQMIYQDPYSSLDPRMRVAELLAEPLRHVPALDAAGRRRRVEEALAEVGLGGFGERFPHALSGGQRQRVAIARAIIRNPAFVVADEPVSALDMTIRGQVLALFRALQEQHGFACLFISHDLSVVGQVADRVLVMQEGCIVEAGSCEEVLFRPRHEYTRALLAAMPAPLAAAPAADLPWPQQSGPRMVSPTTLPPRMSKVLSHPRATTMGGDQPQPQPGPHGPHAGRAGGEAGQKLEEWRSS